MMYVGQVAHTWTANDMEWDCPAPCHIGLDCIAFLQLRKGGVSNAQAVAQSINMHLHINNAKYVIYWRWWCFEAGTACWRCDGFWDLKIAELFAVDFVSVGWHIFPMITWCNHGLARCTWPLWARQTGTQAMQELWVMTIILCTCLLLLALPI